jgi:actin related protein 2/3 complex subunit 5
MDSFRKIDVDKYDEDVLLEEELIDVDTRSPVELAGIAKQKANEVRGLIGR